MLRFESPAILVDSSVWISHFHAGIPLVVKLLDTRRVAIHEFVIGELVLGTLPRGDPAEELHELPRLPLATHEEAIELVRRHRLESSGIGWVDAHLLASAAISGARVWSIDKAMTRAAERIGLAWAG